MKHNTYLLLLQQIRRTHKFHHATTQLYVLSGQWQHVSGIKAFKRPIFLLLFDMVNADTVTSSTDDDTTTISSPTKSHNMQPSSQFTVSLPSSVFKSLMQNRRPRGFAVGWTDVVYKLVHEFVPTCALKFCDNRLRKLGSRQKHAVFWTGMPVDLFQIQNNYAYNALYNCTYTVLKYLSWNLKTMCILRLRTNSWLQSHGMKPLNIP